MISLLIPTLVFKTTYCLLKICFDTRLSILKSTVDLYNTCMFGQIVIVELVP